MTPIINPWVFYWMPVCESVGFITGILGILIAIAAVIFVGGTIMTKLDGELEEHELIKPIATKFTVAAIVLCLISCLTPTEKTLTKMIIAQNVTYERVEVASDTVESVYNDIMEILDKDKE